MLPWPRRRGSGAGTAPPTSRLLGLLCALALLPENSSVHGLGCSEACGIDDAVLLFQTVPQLDRTAEVEEALLLKQAASRSPARWTEGSPTRWSGYASPARWRGSARARRSRWAHKKARRRHSFFNTTDPEGLEVPKSPEWWDEQRNEVLEAADRVEAATGQESAEWWEARARELAAARKKLRKLAFQRAREARLQAAAEEHERLLTRRREEYAAQQAAITAKREAEADRKRQAKDRAEQEERWRADEELAVQEEYGVRMNLTARDDRGNEIEIIFRNATRVRPLLVYIGRMLSVDPQRVKFTHNGRQFDFDTDVGELGLRNHDVIEVSGTAGAEVWSLEEPAAKLRLRVETTEGRQVRVDMFDNAKLQGLMHQVCVRLRMKQAEVRFMYHGARLDRWSTPRSVGLSDLDVIQVEPDYELFEARRRAEEEAKQKAEEAIAKQRARERAEWLAAERSEILAWHKEAALQLEEAESIARRQAAAKAGDLSRLQKMVDHEEAVWRHEEAERDAAEKEVARQTKFGDVMHLLVKDDHGNELTLRFRTKMNMHALLFMVCKRWGLEAHQTSLTLPGDVTIKLEDTVETLGLKEMDTVQVHTKVGAAQVTTQLRAHVRGRTAHANPRGRRSKHVTAAHSRRPVGGPSSSRRSQEEDAGFMMMEPGMDLDAGLQPME